MPKASIAKRATIRDFSGGWNVADNPFNLASRFLPMSDNVTVGIDGALSPRYGDRLFVNLRVGQRLSSVAAVTLQTFNGSSRIQIVHTAHGFLSGEHITISGASAIGGIPDTDINATHGVRVINANTYDIYVRAAATSNAGPSNMAINYIQDNYPLAGDILDFAYFQDKLVVFDSIGEIAAIDSSGVATRIWSNQLAFAQAGSPAPWRRSDHVSFDTNKKTLLVVNGRLNDKPLEINFQRTSGAIVQYLVDPATVSNAFVPKGDYILCAFNYTMIFGTDNVSGPFASDLFVDISALGTTGVYVGNAAPDDAVQIDLGRISQTLDPKIKGACIIRDKILVAFGDSCLLGTLGIYTSGGAHEPDFKDQIPQHGSLNHRVIRNIGNDVLMTDTVGVPSFTQSQQSQAIVPNRVSQFIAPKLSTHLASLTDDTLKNRTFTTYNVRDREYMLFVPKFDTASQITLPVDAMFSVTEPLGGYVIVNIPNHRLEIGDWLDFDGAAMYPGTTAGVNATRVEVVHVLDADFVMIFIDLPTMTPGQQFGGSDLVAKPVNDETIVYSYQLNPLLKIRRWKRYRGLQYAAAVVTRNGAVIVGYQGKIFRFGTDDYPIYADKELEYDFYTWEEGKLYLVGQRVREQVSATVWRVFIALTNHVSATGVTFAIDRATNPDNWEEYTGNTIYWAAETAWSDLDERAVTKTGSDIIFDTQGTAHFTTKVYADSVYPHSNSFYRLPDEAVVPAVHQASIEFVGGDAGGFGFGTQTYGTGRRTREPLDMGFPFDGRIIKLRYEGDTKERLRIVSTTLTYLKGL